MKVDDRLLFTIRESADILGLGKSTLWRLLLSGAVPSVKVGGKRMMRRSDIEELARDGWSGHGAVRDLPTKA